MVLACVVGAGALSAALRTDPGSRAFVAWAAVAAGIWLLGSLPWTVSVGPAWRSHLVIGIAAGIALTAVALGLAALTSGVPGLAADAERLVAYAEGNGLGAMVPLTLASAFSEEVLFRGAWFSRAPRRSSATSTIAYVAAAAATGNVALALAALMFGSAAAAIRTRTGTVVAPVTMHMTFSLLMLLFVPLVV